MRPNLKRTPTPSPAAIRRDTMQACPRAGITPIRRGTSPNLTGRIGDLGIVAIPFEVFAETGLEIKRRTPFVTGGVNM